MSILLAPAGPDPVAPIEALVDGVGGQVLDAAVSFAPIAVPYVLAMTGKIDAFEQRQVQRRLAAEYEVGEARRAARRERAAARKAAALNSDGMGAYNNQPAWADDDRKRGSS
jgi:hypothetical protein